MQNCKDPEWNIIKPKQDSYSLRVVDNRIQLIKNDKVLVSDIDLAPVIQSVLEASKKKKKQ